MPPPPLTQYEIDRIRRMQENAEKCQEFGIPPLVSSLMGDGAENSKGKGKKGKGKNGKELEDCDSQYIPENEGDDQSDGSSEVGLSI